MEQRKPHVKYLTKALIFTLCCVLCVGVLPLTAYAVERPSVIPIWARGVLPTGGSIVVMGEEHQITVQGEKTLDDYDLSYNMTQYPLQKDLNGKYYLEVQVNSYATTQSDKVPFVKIYENDSLEPTIYKLSYLLGGDVDIDISGYITDLFIEIPYQSYGDIVTYTFYLTFDDDSILEPDPLGDITIEFYNKQNFGNSQVTFQGSNTYKSKTVANLPIYDLMPTFKADTKTILPYTSQSGLPYYDIVLNDIGERTYIGADTKEFGDSTIHINDREYLYNNQIIEVYLPLNITEYIFSVGLASGTRVNNVTLRVYYSVGEAYSSGYQKGLDDGYERGLRDGRNENNSILTIITDPLTALFGITLIEYDGLTITLGTVFFTTVGITLLLVFLKYFAGG